MSAADSNQITPSQKLEELIAKIERLRDTILDFSKVETETHSSVKQQFMDIFEDAKRLRMGRNELRRMLHESFHSRGPRAAKISESYLRRLMPPEYKYPEKARLDYQVRQEQKGQKLEESTMVLKEVQQQQVANIPKEGSQQMLQLQTENKEQKDEIESLRNEIGQLKDREEIWTAIAIVQIGKMRVPLIITVNNKERRIENVKFDVEAARKARQDRLRQRKGTRIGR
jgi:uncharacterized phage infection (PIP) family protein YhgE